MTSWKKVMPDSQRTPSCNLLFGHRTIEELSHIYVDLPTKDLETRGLINALFPKRVSQVWADIVVVYHLCDKVVTLVYITLHT